MDKVSKDSVNYRAAEDEQRCGNCAMFNRRHGNAGTCDLVLGKITANAVCDKWVAK